MLKPKSLQKNQGFTLVEVLVAILITTLFISAAMQTMVIAAIFKIKAQEFTEATNWIQTDLEEVKYKAANFQFPQTTLAANVTTLPASSITGVAATSFPTNGSLRVGLDATSYTFSRSGNTLNITPSLVKPQVSGAAIMDTTMCNATTRNAGLANGLRDIVTVASSDDSNYVESTKTFRTGKTFTMRKTTTTSANPPYNVLQIKYEVSPGATLDSSKTIARFDTEVIPNVAFQCP